MTTMKRNTISFPDDLADRVLDLRMRKAFRNCSYSELVRMLVELGLKAVEENTENAE